MRCISCRIIRGFFHGFSKGERHDKKLKESQKNEKLLKDRDTPEEPISLGSDRCAPTQSVVCLLLLPVSSGQVSRQKSSNSKRTESKGCLFFSSKTYRLKQIEDICGEGGGDIDSSTTP